MSVDLEHHGDAELAPGLVDLAVNVRSATPPAWLRDHLRAAIDDVAAYPNDDLARAAVAHRYGRPVSEVLITAGAAEAFVLLARAMQPQRAVAVHPSFTEPEAALERAGVRVDRVVLPPPFHLDPALIPASADFVVLGNPTNPTGVLHPRHTVEALVRPGRTTVVDEAFMEFVPGGRESISERDDAVVVRSLTKMWGLAGLRVGYALGPAPIIARLAAARPPWPVSSLACAAVVACMSRTALDESDAAAEEIRTEALTYAGELGDVPGVTVFTPNANFLLVRTPGRTDVREALRAAGFAVRRCDTFPGLGPDYLRIAVRDPATNAAVCAAIREVLS